MNKALPKCMCFSLAALIAFNDKKWGCFNGFVCSEAFATFKAFTPAANGVDFICRTAVKHFAFGVLTEWTFHGGFPFNNLFYFIFFNK